MLFPTTTLASLSVLLSLALPSLAKASTNPPSFFPANLAKRLTSPNPSGDLSKRTPTTPTVKERSVSDEIVAMLVEARAAAHKASASASPSAIANIAKAQDHPVASASISASARARAARNLDAVKKVIRDTPWEVLDSTLLCPGGATACPIFPRMGSYECIDTMSELESCGGCASKNEGEDCTQIKGAQGVTCNSGRCQVFTCQQGYKLERDGKGRDRCRKVRKETV